MRHFSMIGDQALIHPALLQLIRLRGRARLRRWRRRLITPRRLVLSVVALILAVLWLGNAIASILFRQSADPERLGLWVPLGFAAYGLWHVVKAAYRRPEQDIEWLPAERAILTVSPLSRGQLLTYRLATVFGATVLKATCFTLLMIPDLKLLTAGFVGALLALLLLELWRINVELIAFSVSDRTYTKIRIAVLGAVAGIGLAMLLTAVSVLPNAGRGEPLALLALLKELGGIVMQAESTSIGRVVLAPFHLLSGVVLAAEFDTAFTFRLFSVLALLGVAVVVTYRMDALLTRHRNQRSQRAYQASETIDQHLRSAPNLIRRSELFTAPGPLWALAWRQMLGARHYWTSLLIAFAAPAIMALVPLVVYHDARVAVMNVFGGIAFYSLLLLPPALRFDLRRDIDRMALLKSLPIEPRVIVAGQLATPVILASSFQLLVLLVAAMIRPVSPAYLLFGWLMLLPTNVAIFALDNVLFLLYPYRPNQEGLEVFLRTMLTFTAKGLLFAVALAIAAAWALASGWIAHRWLPVSDPRATTRLLCVVGFSTMTIGAAIVTVHMTIKAYGRFDASQDVPA